MKTKIYILIIFILGYSCNNVESKKVNLNIEGESLIDSNSSSKKTPITANYLVGQVKNQHLAFFLTDKIFHVVENLFIYKPIGSIYLPDEPCRIDTINWVCYFFDYEVDYANDYYINNFLIAFNLKTGKHKIHRDFKDFNISEWELDITKELLIFRDYEQNKLFTYSLHNDKIDTLFDFTTNIPNHLKINPLTDYYELLSKEKHITLKRIIDSKNGDIVHIDTIWKNSAPLVNPEFKINNETFIEVSPNDINQDIVTLFVYGNEGKRSHQSLEIKYTGNYEGIYWLNNQIIIRIHNQILVYNEHLELIKTVNTGLLKDIFYSHNQFIIFEQVQPKESFLVFDSNFEFTELDSEIFKNLMIIQAIPNKITGIE